MLGCLSESRSAFHLGRPGFKTQQSTAPSFNKKTTNKSVPAFLLEREYLESPERAWLPEDDQAICGNIQILHIIKSSQTDQTGANGRKHLMGYHWSQLDEKGKRGPT